MDDRKMDDRTIEIKYDRTIENFDTRSKNGRSNDRNREFGRSNDRKFGRSDDRTIDIENFGRSGDRFCSEMEESKSSTIERSKSSAIERSDDPTIEK